MEPLTQQPCLAGIPVVYRRIPGVKSSFRRPGADGSRLRLVVAAHGGGDAAARREGADDAAPLRGARRDEVVEQAVDDGLVERPLRAVALEVELERLQLDAGRRGGVGEGDGAEVGLAGLGAEAGELGADDLDGVVAA